jgi:hypothetical protein
MVETKKRILDQTCFACKKTPSFDDGFTSDNKYACPEMSYIICQSCKGQKNLETNILVFISYKLGPNSLPSICSILFEMKTRKFVSDSP